MRQMKPPWVKSNLPRTIKVKLWDIIRQTNTYPNMCKHLANYPDSLTDFEWRQLGTTRDTITDSLENTQSIITRDTYKALQNEIRDIPLREVALLPEELHNWARGLKGDTHLKQSIESLIESQEIHVEDLANAARRLADNLKPYLQEVSGYLGDYVIGNEDEQEFEEQLQADSPTKWLLSHMKTELLQLRTLNKWLEIPTKYIDNQLLERLYLRASQKYFPGECKECENWC